MTLFDQLRILKVPLAFKVILAALLIALVALNGYVIVHGLLNQRYDFWIAAGASLLAAGAPILAVLSFLVITEFGTGALKRRMQHMLAVEIPSELQFSLEAPPPPFRTLRDANSLNYRPNRARVECGIYRDELWANYRVTGRASGGATQTIDARLEFTMSRINLNILSKRAAVCDHLRVSPNASLAEIGSAFFSAFQHTIDGSSNAGYKFNALPLCRSHQADEEIAFVASRPVSIEFVWDPATRLEMIHDLVLMLRSFADEQPRFFAAA